MGGGLIELVAYGAQDIYITGNPQITFFKVVYRRHTNYSIEAIEQTLDGIADFGNRVTCNISRNGDLISRIYLEHSVSTKSVSENKALGITFDYGSHVMKEYEIEIGGQQIDKQYGHWHSVWSSLREYNPSGHSVTLFNSMVGNGAGFDSQQASADEGARGWVTTNTGGTHHTIKTKNSLKIPLYFWFCRNIGLALPLIALQYHEIKLNIIFEHLDRLILEKTNGGHDWSSSSGTWGEPAKVSGENIFKLWGDYVYLDTDERRRFAQASHEYLIEQLQFMQTSNNNTELYFNHPVKELIWTGVRTDAYSNGSTPPIQHSQDKDPLIFYRNKLYSDENTTYKLLFNGIERFVQMNYRYFTRKQKYDNHTGPGFIKETEIHDSIAVYSFALNPEEHQPSGTCNFSRIDNSQLIHTGNNININIYAINYNVLRIMSGMGGLAYSN